MPAIKFSRQRESIRNYLSHTKEHPTADIIYNNIKKEYPNISLGTVYRNLNLLVEQGEIRRLTCGDGMDHFDYDTSEHYHFICTNCHKVVDLQMDSISHINVIAAANFNGEIEGSCTYFYGKCPNCKTSSK